MALICLYTPTTISLKVGKALLVLSTTTGNGQQCTTRVEYVLLCGFEVSDGKLFRARVPCTIDMGRIQYRDPIVLFYIYVQVENGPLWTDDGQTLASIARGVSRYSVAYKRRIPLALLAYSLVPTQT
jgi:hypothetical protein